MVHALPGIGEIHARIRELHAQGEELWDVLDTPDAFAGRKEDAWFEARQAQLRGQAATHCANAP